MIAPAAAAIAIRDRPGRCRGGQDLARPAPCGTTVATPMAGLAVGCGVAACADCRRALACWPCCGHRPPYPQATGSWAGQPGVFEFLSAGHRTASCRSRPALARDAAVVVDRQPARRRRGRTIADCLSLAMALADVFGGGLFLIFRRVRPEMPPPPGVCGFDRPHPRGGPGAWYHYRLLHLPGLAWLTLVLMTRRDHRGLALLGGLVAVITWSHLAWLAPVGIAVEPWFVLARGLLVPVLELVLAAWYLRAATHILPKATRTHNSKLKTQNSELNLSHRSSRTSGWVRQCGPPRAREISWLSSSRHTRAGSSSSTSSRPSSTSSALTTRKPRRSSSSAVATLRS